uniref:CoA transferase n=1 Tax=Frankia sp. Cppng1_Ct_nod TaxID=2897162 RepID=UPI002024E3A7
MPAPLDGFRVLDLSIGVAGGYTTKLLADAGAEVVKCEDAAGDPLRRWSASGA